MLIDGKSIAEVRTPSTGLPCSKRLGAEYQITLEQLTTEEKSNEITVILVLI